MQDTRHDEISAVIKRAMRARITRDTWQLHIHYGQGWEHETTEDSRVEAIAQQKCYRENCPQYPTKIVRKRERIEPCA